MRVGPHPGTRRARSQRGVGSVPGPSSPMTRAVFARVRPRESRTSSPRGACRRRRACARARDRHCRPRRRPRGRAAVRDDRAVDDVEVCCVPAMTAPPSTTSSGSVRSDRSPPRARGRAAVKQAVARAAGRAHRARRKAAAEHPPASASVDGRCLPHEDRGVRCSEAVEPRPLRELLSAVARRGRSAV